MEISGHIKTKWAIRGDYTRDAEEAWTEGLRVRLPNYNYNEARYDDTSGIILLSRGGSVTTAITYYDHMEMIPLEDVICLDCRKVYNRCDGCPSCESDSWTKK